MPATRGRASATPQHDLYWQRRSCWLTRSQHAQRGLTPPKKQALLADHLFAIGDLLSFLSGNFSLMSFPQNKKYNSLMIYPWQCSGTLQCGKNTNDIPEIGYQSHFPDSYIATGFAYFPSNFIVIFCNKS
jgi:hypothetical protein